MAALVLHRYPRLPRDAHRWFTWAARVDSWAGNLNEVADRWDANSTITFMLDVEVALAAAQDLEVADEIDLLVTASCSPTAVSVSSRVRLERRGDSLRARAEVKLHGHQLAEKARLTAVLVAPFGDLPWLRDRIIAEGPTARVALRQEAQGFPVSVVSFDAEGWRASPWRFEVLATHPADTFDQALRLFVNEDFPEAAALLDGSGSKMARTLLEAAIARQLIATASYLAQATTQELDAVAAENPDSVAAAGAKAANRYFGSSLKDTCRLYREQPERFEHSLMHETRILQGEA